MAKHPVSSKNINRENFEDFTEQEKDVLKLIKKLARQLASNGYSQKALQKIGLRVMKKVLPSYKGKNNARPSTYCYWPIRKAMEQAIQGKYDHKAFCYEASSERFQALIDGRTIDNLPLNRADKNLLRNLTENQTPETLFIRQESVHVLHTLLQKSLSKRNAAILKLYYSIGGEELTYQEIGDRYQLSRERIRQIIKESIVLLRQQARLN